MNLPTTDPAKRIAALFGRRLTTPWSEKEVKAFKQLVKDGLFTDLRDLSLVERYHNHQKKMGSRGFHRRDLQTFLNNFRGELDRAQEWSTREKRVVKSSNGQKEGPAQDEDFKRAGELAKNEVERLRETLKLISK